MQFSHQIEVRAPVAGVWDFLWQAEQVGACLPGCRDVRTIEPFQRYEAMVEERVGPFRASFSWTIDVQSQEPRTRIEILARGRDQKLAATARVQMAVHLHETGDQGCLLTLETDIQITGKIASLGHSVLQRKADQVVGEFAQAMQTRLNGVGSGAGHA